MRKALLFIFLISLSIGLSAQSHNAVPLSEESLYDFIAQAEMRGFIRYQRAVKPYPKSLIVSLLNEMQGKQAKMSAAEKSIFQDFYDKYVVDEDQGFWKDGDLRFEEDFFSLRADVYAEAQMNAQLNELKDSGAYLMGGLSLQGDIAQNFSWGLDLSGGAYKTDDYDVDDSYGPTAWEPYTFTKNWDGGVHPINGLNLYKAMPSTLAFGYIYDTEIAASFFENKLDLRYGRLRREWGIGENPLFLTGNARPFMGVEGVFTPWNWINVAFLTGALEYGENFRTIDDYNIKSTSRTQQNMFSILQVEIMPTDWLYIAFSDSGVYMKRPELGYLHPLFSQFFYQNNVGDFDNLAFGGTIALQKAGLGRTYFSVFLDEARFNHPDFFGNYSNMYSFQTGLEAPVPGLPWTTALLQYTKVEPFTYTHYVVDSSPWYNGLEMETDYLNNGESLGSGLEPNSDELMLKFNSQPKKGFTAEFGYRMVRHGTGAGSDFSPWGGGGYLTNDNGEYIYEDGSLVPIQDPDDPGFDGVWLTPDNDPNGAYGQEGRKDFLKDAVYEWFHIFSLGGTWELENQPLSFGANYSYVLKYYTDYQNNGDFSAINSGVYANQHKHLLTLYMKIFP